jgi:hypothetical protein
MKAVKKLVICMILIAPLFLVPKQSKAGGLGDLLSFLFGNDHKKKDPPVATHNNSVPLNGAAVVLMAAGLGLGVVTLIRVNRNKVETASI